MVRRNVVARVHDLVVPCEPESVVVDAPPLVRPRPAESGRGGEGVRKGGWVDLAPQGVRGLQGRLRGAGKCV